MSASSYHLSHCAQHVDSHDKTSQVLSIIDYLVGGSMRFRLKAAASISIALFSLGFMGSAVASDSAAKQVAGDASASTVATPNCFASPGLAVGSSITAYGFGRCMYTPPLTLGVAVILYHNGWYVNDSYTSCSLSSGGGDCQGINVTSAYASGNWCSRVLIDYIEPGTGKFQQSASSTGAGCP